MTPGFLLAPCDGCGRVVLLTHDLVEERLVTRCIHCEALVDESLAQPAEPEELARLGYVVEGLESAHGDRGCRDGQCGVRQLER